MQEQWENKHFLKVAANPLLFILAIILWLFEILRKPLEKQQMARKNNDRFNEATGSPSAARQEITLAPLKTIGKTTYSCDDAVEHHCRSNCPIGAAWEILWLSRTLETVEITYTFQMGIIPAPPWSPSPGSLSVEDGWLYNMKRACKSKVKHTNVKFQ